MSASMIIRPDASAVDLHTANMLGGVTLAGVTIKEQADYDKMKHKPSINGVELDGNKTAEELGLASGDYDDLWNKPSINGVELDGNKTAEDLGITGAGTKYDFDEGDVDGAIAVTPTGGETQSVKVHGLQGHCFEDALTEEEILTLLDAEDETEADGNDTE